MIQNETNAQASEAGEFLDELVAELRPVEQPARSLSALVGWLGVATALFAGSFLVTGELRPDLASDLATRRLVLELILGSAAVLTLTAAGLEFGVPGTTARRARGWLAIALLGAWALWLYFGSQLAPEWTGPAHAMIGKRPHCFIEGIAFSAIPATFGIIMLRRRAFLHGAAAGALLGLATATFCGIIMQLACMYEPVHALEFHLTPIPIWGIVGAIGGHLLLADR